MATFYYTLSENRGKALQPGERKILFDCPSFDDVIPYVYNSLLEQLRERRFAEFLEDIYSEDNSDTSYEDYLARLVEKFENDMCKDEKGTMKKLRDSLHEQYKPYAYNLHELKERLASLYEVSKKYAITNIEPAPDCYGCLYDCPGQRDHMECPGGCLHDTTLCDICDQ